MILTVTMNVAIDKRYVVEEFKKGEVLRVKHATYTAGGKGLNVARVASITGEDVIATGIIGGFAGEYIKSELNSQNIKNDFVKVNSESRSCVNIYDESDKSQTEFLEPGSVVTEQDLEEFLTKFKVLVKDADVVTISGSLPRGARTDFYKELIRIAKNEGKAVMLDTSGKLLEEGITENPTFIKPNTDEIAMLLNENVNDMQKVIDAAIILHKKGIEYVVVSLGKDGAILVCNEGVFKGNTPDIPVVNTVGCGDSMVGAFAVGISRGMGIEETFKLALAISTANALREETGFYIKEDMEILQNMVTIDKKDLTL